MDHDAWSFETATGNPRTVFSVQVVPPVWNPLGSVFASRTQRAAFIWTLSVLVPSADEEHVARSAAFPRR